MEMATLVQMDKENGDIGNLASSIRRDSSKLFSKRVQSPHKVKSFNAPRTRAHRKVLGNVNKPAESSKPFMTKKVHKGKSCDQISEETYPEIETFIPYNPLDYESLEVPEEHKLSHLCLAGLPLLVSVRDKDRFDALTNAVIFPMEMLPVTWQCDTLQDFIPFFEDITIDLPPVCDL